MDKREEFIQKLKVSEEDLYREHKRKRNERVYKKFGKDYREQKREREQKELLEDLEMEFNERNRGGYGRC